MPLYEYQCDDCGPFEARAPMAECARSAACPKCSAPARRVLLTAPRIAGMSAHRREAHELNERSADSPKRGAPHQFDRPDRQARQTGDGPRKPDRNGAKGFPGRRPWMISH